MNMFPRSCSTILYIICRFNRTASFNLVQIEHIFFAKKTCMVGRKMDGKVSLPCCSTPINQTAPAPLMAGQPAATSPTSLNCGDRAIPVDGRKRLLRCPLPIRWTMLVPWMAGQPAPTSSNSQNRGDQGTPPTEPAVTPAGAI